MPANLLQHPALLAALLLAASNLFMTFALVRSICYNALWVGACWWYSSGALVDIKRECVAVESVGSGRMLRRGRSGDQG